MKPAKDACIVLVTAPGLRVARSLATKALKAKLVACANLVPGIESHYWWQGKMEKGGEVLMVLKTSRRLARDLETLILTHHPYDTPEFIVLPVRQGSARYLAWWLGSLAPAGV